MVWYEDPNLVTSIIINAILLIAGFWRRGLLYPIAGFVLTAVTYNYYYNTANENLFLMFLGFILGHLISLIRALKENL